MKVIKAIWNNVVIAESSETIIIENNHYFPESAVHLVYLKQNGESYTCPWKGHADYFDVVVGSEVNKGAAWMYPEPNEKAKEITGYYAFWKGVTIE